MSSLKIIFLIIAVLYLGILISWCFRFPISNKIVGVNPNLIESRSLTHEESKRIDEAYLIRRKISNILLYCSVLTFASIFIMKNYLRDWKIMVKILFYLSGIIAALLMLVNGIHFVPGPPIR